MADLCLVAFVQPGHFYDGVTYESQLISTQLWSTAAKCFNPNDHQGIRHLLTNYYLELEMADDRALLLEYSLK